MPGKIDAGGESYAEQHQASTRCTTDDGFGISSLLSGPVGGQRNQMLQRDRQLKHTFERNSCRGLQWS